MCIARRCAKRDEGLLDVAQGFGPAQLDVAQGFSPAQLDVAQGFSPAQV
jgi:hypothetical protein